MKVGNFSLWKPDLAEWLEAWRTYIDKREGERRDKGELVSDK